MLKEIYYSVKPFLPRSFQIWLRRQLVLRRRHLYCDVWPIDPAGSDPPEGWSGWPDNKKFALVLTHDVDTAKGQENVHKLAELEDRLRFRSSFNFVPERYSVSPALRRYLTSEGFEVGLHGLYHDGKLFFSRKIFSGRAEKINRYIDEWGSVGFRSPAMHHNLEWIQDLNIEYDASTFDTDPFEPYSGGVGTIFPFWVDGHADRRGYVELPYTLPQDHTLFVIMKHKNISIWKKKLDWIAEKGGMALLNTHPDYMNFDGRPLSLEQYPFRFYEEFLEHVWVSYENQYWHALPREVAEFWRRACCVASANESY